ncbi:hypothetical protein BKA82DRAFT_4018647 [Pisolithus tinctorius]|nr:hypothetical protein BKA82DRAFT_4018647 [Pisolithus tinctorius]
MDLMDCVSTYMVSRLREEVIGGPCALPHVSILLQIACKADHILLVIVEAYRECIIVEEMRDVNVIVDHSSYAEIDCPTAVIDKEGNILLWYLPNAFGEAYQAEIWNSLGNLSIPLARSVKSNGAGGWRHDSNHFRPATDLKGAIDLSPAWFQQGHGPSNPSHHPEVSLLLKEKSGANETRQWLDSMAGLHTVLLGALRIMHPKMYLHGREALMRLRSMAVAWQDEDMQAILPIWNSVYSSMSLMVNRKSPPHKDTNG